MDALATQERPSSACGTAAASFTGVNFSSAVQSWGRFVGGGAFSSSWDGGIARRTVPAPFNQRERVDCGTPTSSDSAVADTACGPLSSRPFDSGSLRSTESLGPRAPTGSVRRRRSRHRRATTLAHGEVAVLRLDSARAQRRRTRRAWIAGSRRLARAHAGLRGAARDGGGPPGERVAAPAASSERDRAGDRGARGGQRGSREPRRPGDRARPTPGRGDARASSSSRARDHDARGAAAASPVIGRRPRAPVIRVRGPSSYRRPSSPCRTGARAPRARRVPLPPLFGEMRRVQPSRRSNSPAAPSAPDAIAASAFRTIRSLYSAVNDRRLGRSVEVALFGAPTGRPPDRGRRALARSSTGGLLDGHVQHRDSIPAGPRQ
jgi:hypothetical protein